MSTFDLRVYARRGAEVRLAEINRELASIYSAFPDLRQERRGRVGADTAERDVAHDQPARHRKPMSAAQRRAVSRRMKKYWAERRKHEKAK